MACPGVHASEGEFFDHYSSTSLAMAGAETVPGERLCPTIRTAPFPTWLWDPTKLTLSPRCPACGQRLVASGSRSSPA